MLVVVSVFARQVLEERFQALERPPVEDSVQRALNALAQEASIFASTVIDWAHWDETHQFALTGDPAYIEANFGDPRETLSNLNADFVVILGRDGVPVMAYNYNFERERLVDIDPELVSRLGEVQMSARLDAGEQPVTVAGYARTTRRLLVMATANVLPTSREGDSVGTFTFGRYVGEDEITELSESLRTAISILPTNREALPAATRTASAALSETNPLIVQALDNDSIAGFGLLRDIDGVPVAILKTLHPRDVWQQGQATIQLLSLIIMMVSLIISVITYLVVDRLVVNRITHLSGSVDKIEATGNLRQTLPVDASDEIASLSGNINKMLSKLDVSQQELQTKNLALQDAMSEVVESARLKTEFLSVMSHELRTPLNAIIGYSGIMLNGINGELDDEATRMVGSIFDSSKHLLNLVNDILDLSKIDAGRMELVDEPYAIRDTVSQVDGEMRVLADEKDLAFATFIAPDVPEAVRGDRERVKQIIINLLSNAFKFTEMGSVSLDIGREGDSLRIMVTDTGIGIPAHALNYIFEDFRQVDASSRRTQRGTGLGLSIVRKLAGAMGGKASVTSEVGVGSTFIVTLPIHPLHVESDLALSAQPNTA
jgi:signal transduction histidine kinase